jgi:hypothetical protein
VSPHELRCVDGTIDVVAGAIAQTGTVALRTSRARVRVHSLAVYDVD